MSKIGSPVCGCSPTSPPFEAIVGKPVDPDKHKNCRIKLLSVKEKDNDESAEYIGSATEIHVKGLSHDLRIRYEVTVCAMSVTLWLEIDGNPIHGDFYKTYEGQGVTGKRVVVVEDGVSRDPGVHEALWDGRDKTVDHRILLDGTYKLRIQGLHDATPTDESTIRIMPPFSWNFGIHYAGGNTTKKEIEHAKAAQTKLSDGTFFSSNATCAELASVAWAEMQSAAAGAISGHSSPTALGFYPEESTPGKPVIYKGSKCSRILSRSSAGITPQQAAQADLANSVFLPEQPANALRDVFLIVLAGCKAGNEILLIQTRLKELAKAFDPGSVDKKHGPKTTAALQAWQQWEHIEPADGTKNEATLQRMGIDPALDEASQTAKVQAHLKALSRRYHPGEPDGAWGPKTETAITNYQQDHSPPLDVTSLPDRATAKHLHPAGSMEGEARNIAEAFIGMGCNIAFGFVKSVSFPGAEKWHINFWDLATQGSGVDDAAAQARVMCGAKHFKELEYSIYHASGVDKNSALHPARHGRDL